MHASCPLQDTDYEKYPFSVLPYDLPSCRQDAKSKDICGHMECNYFRLYPSETTRAAYEWDPPASSVVGPYLCYAVNSGNMEYARVAAASLAYAYFEEDDEETFLDVARDVLMPEERVSPDVATDMLMVEGRTRRDDWPFVSLVTLYPSGDSYEIAKAILQDAGLSDSEFEGAAWIASCIRMGWAHGLTRDGFHLSLVDSAADEPSTEVAHYKATGGRATPWSGLYKKVVVYEFSLRWSHNGKTQSVTIVLDCEQSTACMGLLIDAIGQQD
jgi:hypothetical protein